MKPVFKSTVLGLAGALCAYQGVMAADLPSVAPAPIAPAPVFLFSDTSISYLLETSATDPGSAVHFVKNIANVTHVDAWTYGSNFATASFLQSTNADPANPILQNQFAPFNFSGQGSLELYTLYRGSLSGNALTHSSQFAVKPIFLKDVSLYFGADGEVQNTAYAPRKRDIVGGLQFAFDVPGYLTIAVDAYKEWGHNGLSQCTGQLNPGCIGLSNANYNSTTGTLSYNVTPEFELGYFQPLTFTGLPLSITGFTDVVLPKGQNPVNAFTPAGTVNNTHTEILSKNQLVLDIGKVLGYKKGFADIFVGYKYWANKFGNNGAYNATNLANGSYLPGTFESQVYAGVTLHVF